MKGRFMNNNERRSLKEIADKIARKEQTDNIFKELGIRRI